MGEETIIRDLYKNNEFVIFYDESTEVGKLRSPRTPMTDTYGKKWTCEKCTFDNLGDSETCEICDAAKPEVCTFSISFNWVRKS